MIIHKVNYTINQRWAIKNNLLWWLLKATIGGCSILENIALYNNIIVKNYHINESAETAEKFV